MGNREELESEQAYVDAAYDALADRRQRAATLGDSASTRSLRTLYERDERAAVRGRRQAELELGELPLCFGRIDLGGAGTADDGDGEGNETTWYIGRMHVDGADGEPLVLDWRAPVAEPFYRATTAEPMGVLRRRHLHCRGRLVRALDDEILTHWDSSAGELSPVAGSEVVGEAALLRALSRRRTGRMGDVAATIQADQDRVVRAPLEQTLVVQGGPGTGKTAIALHRVAYLLYTHREELEAKGVLILGPNRGFIRYIERVLPSLGEGGATYRPLTGLRDGVTVTVDEPGEAARIKGDARMSDVLVRAVQSRQRPLAKVVTVGFGAYRLRIGPKATSKIVAAVAARPGRHNERRQAVERRVLRALHRGYLGAVDRARRAEQRPEPPVSEDSFVEQAGAQRDVRDVLDRVWPVLTPEQLLSDLWRWPALFREAAGGILTSDEIAAITDASAHAGGWSRADAALLDELDVLLGPVPRPAVKKKAAEDLDWLADRVLDGVAADEDVSLSASMAAEIRQRIADDQVGRDEPARPATVARTFGHVVVDEAQDLSPMEWRMVARRCPRGAFTVVGDSGQASEGWNIAWSDVIGTISGGAGGEVVELTVNYRTPAQVMDLAAAVLASAAPEAVVPVSVRDGEVGPEVVPADRGELSDTVADHARRLLTEVDGGTLAVIAPAHLHSELRRSLDSHDETRAAGGEPLDETVALLSPAGAKGLEFDGVLVVEPAAIAGGTTTGLMALYVALTRTTDRLVIVHADPLPAPLAAATRVVAGVASPA